jgi:hypothetical protein
MSVHRRCLSILAEAVLSSDDPAAGLAQLRRDKDAVRREIQKVLDRYAAKHGIALEDVHRLSEGYIEDLVADVFVDREEALDIEIEHTSSPYWAMSRAIA